MYGSGGIISKGAGVAASEGGGGAAMNENNELGRSGQHTSEAGWQRATVSAHASDAGWQRGAVSAHTTSPSQSFVDSMARRSRQPQTVTARMVDPSMADDTMWTASGHASHGLASVSADYPPRHNSHYGGYSPSMQYRHNQQQQPTLAALALADSRGQLDSGLGHYYQQPGRMRPDYRASQGFYSEPASGAGSPVFSVSSASARGPPMRSGGSVDYAMLNSGMAPGASALGVMFPSTATTKTIADAAVQRGSSSSRRNSRDSNQRNTELGGARTVQRDAVASHESARSDILAHGAGVPSMYGDSAGHPSMYGESAGHLSMYSDSAGQPSIYADGAGQPSQLSVLPEDSLDGVGANGNNRRHMAHSELTPQPSLPSTPSASAASLTAASSSFSFRNQRVQSHHQSTYSTSSQHQPHHYQQHPAPGNGAIGSNPNRHSTATNNNRDSMFLRLKEKIKYFKPRSRPQSDNLTDRRPQGLGPQNTGQQVSPSFKGSKSPGSVPQLFGTPLAYAVKVAGVHVGRVAASGEACVVPTLVAVCGQHLWDHGQQTQGIFRVNGSMKRVQRLQEEFNTPPSYGRHAEWDGYTLHDAATILRRYLTSLPESVISSEHYSAFMDKLADTVPDDVKARDYGTMIEHLLPEARHTLLYMLELLAGFARPANNERTLMNSSNLAAVLQPCLLVHPGHIANPQEYSKAKDVVEFLIVHAAAIYPANRASGSMASEHTACAGLIVFETGEAHSVDGDRGKFVASDDGATLDTGAADGRGVQQQQQNRWSSTYTRESTATAVQPGELAPAAQHVANGSVQGAGPNVGTVPPRGDSLVAVDMTMSTPVMSSAGHGMSVLSSTPVLSSAGQGVATLSSTSQVRSLGSVTARLYDPESPPHDDSSSGLQPFGSHSNMALNSIQYQYTVPSQARTREAWAGSSTEPTTATEPRSPTSARPRRSLSFVVASAATEDVESEEMDASTHDMMNRSSNAVHARRAGHINVPAGADMRLGLGQNRFKKLPPIPQRVVSATASIPVDLAGLPRSASESVPQTQRHEVRRTAATFDSGSGYQIYPRAQPPRTVSVVTGSMASSKTSSAHGQPLSMGQPVNAELPINTELPNTRQSINTEQSVNAGYSSNTGHSINTGQSINTERAAAQAWIGTPEMGAGGRATWLSEDAPEDDYEFIGGKQTHRSSGARAHPTTMTTSRDAPDGEHLRHGAEMAAAAAALTDAQQQKLHPIGHADPMPMSQKPTTASPQGQVSNIKLQQQRGVVSADGSKDKTSMTRLKNIFRMGHGGKSKGPNVDHIEDDGARLTKPISSPLLTPGKFQHQPHSVAAFAGPVFSGAAAPAAVPNVRGLARRDLPRPPQPPKPVESAIGRLQVAVPAGHLSIVYPDSPMSKADTLGRISTDSALKRQSVGPAAGRSGHAYLVNPDKYEESDQFEFDEDDGYKGADLHAAASNTTTLRPTSQMHPQSYRRAAQPGYLTSSATFGQSSEGRRVYGMQRMADSDTQIDRRLPTDTYVLPAISNGSPLLAGMEFDSPTAPSLPQTPYRRSRMYHEATSAVRDDDDASGTNSPRRSRSLRNTITSLRRKLSKSSRSGAPSGSPDASIEETAPTASVH
ncbi:GTPase activating protein (GAP) for Rho1p [Coemansia sp. RSA 1972]|nr:GTPase activating protein (GAP) for Rho1p [Coemansia sp. RSA 1972]